MLEKKQTELCGRTMNNGATSRSDVNTAFPLRNKKSHFVIFPYSYSTDQIRGQGIAVIPLSCIAKRIQKTWKSRTFQYLAYFIGIF